MVAAYTNLCQSLMDTVAEHSGKIQPVKLFLYLVAELEIRYGPHTQKKIFTQQVHWKSYGIKRSAVVILLI